MLAADVKRILYVHHGGTVGGAPLSLLFLLQQLDRTLYEPVVLFLADGPVVDRFRTAGVTVHIAPEITDFSHTELVWYGAGLLWQLPGKLLRLLPSVLRAAAWLRRVQPDLVHLNSSTLAAFAIAARRAALPVVWHIREPLAQGYFGLRRAWLRRVLQQCATRVVAISQFDAAQLGDGVAATVIHNFVDFAVFSRGIDPVAARAHLQLSSAQHVVLMLGGCSRAKGTLPFMLAYASLRRRVPNAVLVIAGAKPEVGAADWLSALATRITGSDRYARKVMAAAGAGIAQRGIRFIGVRSDVPQLLAASDVVVFPSIVPHFARPLIEAAAMAKPVVASDLGGPRELVVHGSTGLLVAPDNPDDLANALAEVLQDPKLAARMGSAGFERARQLFDAQANAARTFALYAEIFPAGAA
jgi:glycosyltransferase involved in cell wall biosynthesis